MNLQSLLNQVLGSSQGSGHQGQGGAPSSSGGSHLGKYLAGGAAGGALGLLLGSRRGRSVGGKALKYGSVAAVGALAWKLYQDHQAKQQAQAAQPAQPAAGAPVYRAPAALPAPSWEQMPVVQIEAHAQAMLKALIAAAKSDGHMDERERELLQGELTRLNADPATRAWVEAELKKPVEPADVAASVTSPEMAAEVYLASLLVVDETTTMERAYLDELARRLNLPPALKADLEAKAAAA